MRSNGRVSIGDPRVGAIGGKCRDTSRGVIERVKWFPFTGLGKALGMVCPQPTSWALVYRLECKAGVSLTRLSVYQTAIRIF